jgi:hypothetical protein
MSERFSAQKMNGSSGGSPSGTSEMRIRTPILVLTVIAGLASMMPVHAVGVPVLTCKWTGVVRVDSDWSLEATRFSFGSGHGRCTGDGAGPYIVTFSEFFGGGVEIGGAFSIGSTYFLTSTRTGVTREVNQYWNGHETSDCTVAPFRITHRLFVQGVGNMNVCPLIDGSAPPPEPTDYPATFTWRTTLAR